MRRCGMGEVMRTKHSLKDQRNETTLFRYRSLASFALVLLGFFTLIGRYMYLQVMRYDEFVTRSVNNRVKPHVLPPPRGLIYDRNGVPLVENAPAFRLEVVPEQVKDMHMMLARLGLLVPLSQQDIDNFLKQVKQLPRFDNVPLKLHLTEDEIDRFAVNRWRFPGVDVVPYLVRKYPWGGLFAHVLGYVSRINASDLDRLVKARYQGTTHVGRIGIEHYYESVLQGTPGYELNEVNAQGRIQRVLETHPPIPGRNIYLTLDARIQKAAMKAFHGKAGAAVVMDPRNGQVLAMVSVPSFNPNLFVDGISVPDYHALLDNPSKPLFNRAISGIYPPGSTLKPFLALGGLEMGLRRPEDTVVSTGVFRIPGKKRGYRDDRRGGFGKVNMQQAIMLSVNTYFYKLALDMGIDRLSQWMGKFGFGEPTGIDLDNEASGVLPSRAWKAKYNHNRPWYPGETVIAGIGQGYWSVTPLQLTHALATLANHGIAHVPYLALAIQASSGRGIRRLQHASGKHVLVVNQQDWQAVNQGMQMTISNPRGTGYGLGRGFPYAIAGKSGTAERYSRTSSSYNNNRKRTYLASRHRAWFEMFAPAAHPRVAIAVLLESAPWGASSAGPIARKILDAWLATQKSLMPPVQLHSASRTSTAPMPSVQHTSSSR